MSVRVRGSAVQFRLFIHWLLVLLLSFINLTHASNSSMDGDRELSKALSPPQESVLPIRSATFVITWETSLLPSELHFCRFSLKHVGKDIKYMLTDSYDVAELRGKAHMEMENVQGMRYEVFEIHLIGKTSGKTILKSVPLSLSLVPCYLNKGIGRYMCVVELSVVGKY